MVKYTEDIQVGETYEEWDKRRRFKSIKERFFKECPVDYFETDESRLNQDALAKAKEFKLSNNRGLLLMGETGSGKTRIAWMVAKQVLNSEWSICTALNDPSFSREYSTRLGNGTADEWMTSLCKCSCVILDDFGKAAPTPRYKELFYDLLETRMSNRKPLIITTQLGKSQLIERFGDDDGKAIVRRILEFCDIIKL